MNTLLRNCRICIALFVTAALVPILDKYRLNRINLLGGLERAQGKARLRARIRLVW